MRVDLALLVSTGGKAGRKLGLSVTSISDAVASVRVIGTAGHNSLSQSCLSRGSVVECSSGARVSVNGVNISAREPSRRRRHILVAGVVAGYHTRTSTNAAVRGITTLAVVHDDGIALMYNTLGVTSLSPASILASFKVTPEGGAIGLVAMSPTAMDHGVGSKESASA